MREQSGMSVLHVVAAVRPTNAQLHEHCLPLLHERRLAICSLLPATVTPPPPIQLHAGDGSRLGAWRALQAALRAGPYDVVHAHVPVTGALLALAMLTGATSRHACVFTLGNSYGSFRRRNRLLLYPVFALFPQLVLCSAAVKESLPPMLAWMVRRKGTVIPNGVDTDRVNEVLRVTRKARTDGDLDSPPETGGRRGLTVASVGRLVEIKDPHTLLAAFASFAAPDDRLVFVGDGPLGEGLLRDADRAGISTQVEITGLVARDEVYRHVANSDVCVSVSLGEGLPVAVLESMACARPVILSDIPPHRELVEGLDGVPIVATGDVDGLARELLAVRAMPRDQLRDIGHRCRKVVSERYGVAGMHQSLASVYSRAAQRDRSGVGS